MTRYFTVTVLTLAIGFGGCGLLFFALAARAQSLAVSQEITGLPSYTPKGHVNFDNSEIAIPAGHASVVELRFRVDEGFHINSHTPSSDLLIPTVLHLDAVNDLKILSAEYPDGKPFHLAIGDGETLSVYQDDFRVRVMVLAPKGHSTLRGNLHYQACDKAACFPPRNLHVELNLNAQ